MGCVQDNRKGEIGSTLNWCGWCGEEMIFCCVLGNGGKTVQCDGMQAFTELTVFLPYSTIAEGYVVVNGGRIVSYGPMEEFDKGAVSSVRAYPGKYLLPGLVDMHCHGMGDWDAFESPREFLAAARAGGATTVLPTLAYNKMAGDDIDRLLRHVLEQTEGCEPSFCGFHLEGPYMNNKYGAGADLSDMRDPDPEEYLRWIRDFGPHIRLWSFAPELAGTDAFMAAALEAGAVLSAGHTEVSPARLRQAIARGLSVACHALNATGIEPPPKVNSGIRRSGVDEEVMINDHITAELISDGDGVHVNSTFQKILLRTKGPDRICLITDCTPDPGRTPREPGQDVHYNDRNQLSGSRLRMIQTICNVIKHTGCSAVDAVRMASLNPARTLRIDHRVGSISPGKRADLVITEPDFSIHRVLPHYEQ